MAAMSIIGILIALVGGCITDFSVSILVIAVGLIIAAPGAILSAWRESHAEY